jgi:hypothetical protein
MHRFAGSPIVSIDSTRRERKAVRGRAAQSLLVLAILCALSPLALSASDNPTRLRAGLRNSSGSRGLTAEQLKVVLDSLRHKTGFLEMDFDESGFLILGDRMRFAGGSASARALLIAAVDGRQAIELAAYSHAPDIAFARLTAGIIHISSQTKARMEVRQLQLDFADFAELRGGQEVIAAFDLGFAVLHELVHGLLRLGDEVGETARLGACDEQINRMRRELRLPERRGDSPRIQMVMSGTAGTTRRAELVFTRERPPAGRAGTERFYLRWDADRVASATSHSIAATRPALMAVVR